MDTVFGISITNMIIILFVMVIVLFIVLIIILVRISIINNKYATIMSGKKGKDLERIIFSRFKEMDQVKANAKRITREHKEIQSNLSSCISKVGLIKYDAFREMAGNLSFTLALLNKKNTGVVINMMHTREGCFAYAKEIINGESYIVLTNEEKEAIENAKTVEEEIDELVKSDNQPTPEELVSEVAAAIITDEMIPEMSREDLFNSINSENNYTD